jgi:hypothetical protein
MSPGAVAGEEMSDARRNLAKSRNWPRVRANEAMAGREITPYQAQAVADYFALQPDIRKENESELDRPGMGRALIDAGVETARTILPPAVRSRRSSWHPDCTPCGGIAGTTGSGRTGSSFRPARDRRSRDSSPALRFTRGPQSDDVSLLTTAWASLLVKPPKSAMM